MGCPQPGIQPRRYTADLFVHLAVGVGIGAQAVVTLAHDVAPVVEGKEINALHGPVGGLQPLPVKIKQLPQFLFHGRYPVLFPCNMT